MTVRFSDKELEQKYSGTTVLEISHRIWIRLLLLRKY